MYINGRNAVMEAIRSGEGVEKIFLMFGMEGEPIDRIRIEAKRAGIPFSIVDRKRFGDLERSAGLGTRSQGVIALVREIEYEDIEAVVENVYWSGRMPLVAALDGITDPHNVGAVIRSAECSGIDGLMLGKRDSSAITDVVMKTSAGAARHLPIDRVSNVGDMILRLRKSGLVVVGLDEDADMLYTDYDFTRPTLIIVGSEGRGLGHRIKQLCDHRLAIPMRGKVGSLNASVAAGVVFFEAQRQRLAAAPAAPSIREEPREEAREEPYEEPRDEPVA